MENESKECCSKEKGCCGSGCCGKKLVKLATCGLMLWGVGYTINSLVHIYFWWHYYPLLYLAKFFFHRLGISFAAIVFAGMAKKCSCDCKGEKN